MCLFELTMYNMYEVDVCTLSNLDITYKARAHTSSPYQSAVRIMKGQVVADAIACAMNRH